MSNQPSRAFASAFVSAMSATAVQAARNEGLSKRMSAAAIAVIAGLAIGLTTVPGPAQAQSNNAVMRTAMDVFGGVVGGAIGAQIGGGTGKKAATVAGTAAGVWAAEALQQDSAPAPTQRGRVVASSSSLGPVIASGWGNTRVPGSETRYAQPRAAQRQVQLSSGTTQLSDERMSKLVAIEGVFLASRDGYARAIYAAEQAGDDAVLDPGARGVQQIVAATRAQQRQAHTEFDSARNTFVNTVEQIGARGYHVHHFAHSHKIAQERVTASDMRRGDVMRVTRGARIVEEYSQNDSVRGESYGIR